MAKESQPIQGSKVYSKLGCARDRLMSAFRALSLVLAFPYFLTFIEKVSQCA